MKPTHAWLHALVLMAVVAGSFAAGAALTPTRRYADYSADVSLEKSIPRAFGQWHQEDASGAFVVNPQQQALLDVLYSQLLSRIYVNERGQRVMLSVAYGASQGKEMELHRPEVCYVAQGFRFDPQGAGSSTVRFASGQSIGVTRLLARQGGRVEPITYWMRVGDHVIASGFRQQLVRIEAGLHGWIPDGLLFRVSSISDDTAESFKLQEAFASDLMTAVDENTRRMLVGPIRRDDSGGRK